MKKATARLVATLTAPLFAWPLHSFAENAAQPNEEPVQLSMADMDAVTAGDFNFIFAPVFNIVVFYNQGYLQVGNVQGKGGTSNLLGATLLTGWLRN